jgi:predicted nucleic acid-binding protein
MIVVDTSVWIDFLNDRDTPQAAALEGLLGTGRVIVGDLVLTEVLQGLRSDAAVDLVLRRMRLLEFRQMVGWENALVSARNFRTLRSLGVTVRKTIDVLIATFCVASGHSLLHSDRDFDPMQKHLGLQVVSV